MALIIPPKRKSYTSSFAKEPTQRVEFFGEHMTPSGMVSGKIPLSPTQTVIAEKQWTEQRSEWVNPSKVETRKTIVDSMWQETFKLDKQIGAQETVLGKTKSQLGIIESSKKVDWNERERYLADIKDQEAILDNLNIAKELNLEYVANMDRDPKFFEDFKEEMQMGIRDVIKEPDKLLPFAGTVIQGVEFYKVWKAADKMKEGESLTGEEKSLIKRYQAQGLEVKRGGGYFVGQMVASMPTYLAEWGLLKSVVAQPVKQAVGKAITAKVGKDIMITVPKVAKTLWKLPSTKISLNEAVNSSIGMLAHGFTFAAMKTPTNTFERSLPYYKELQNPIFRDAYDDLGGEVEWKKIAIQSFGVNFVEALTEYAGAIVDRPLALLSHATLGRFVSSGKGLQAMGKMAKSVGWNGIFGEVFEEELGELLQAPIEGREYDAPWTPQGFERLLVESLGIGLFGGIGAVAPGIANMAYQNKIGLTIEDVSKGKKDSDIIPKVTPEVAPVAQKPIVEPVKTGVISKELEPLAQEAKNRGFNDRNQLANISSVKKELTSEVSRAKNLKGDIVLKYANIKSTKTIKEMMDKAEIKIWEDASNIIDRNSELLLSEFAKITKEVVEDDQELIETIRGTKGMTADDIMKQYPDINLKRDVIIKDIHGVKKVIPEGEALTPYELKGNKVLLQDGETYVVTKNQYQNIKGNSVIGEAKEFAPELEGIEETIRGASNWQGDNLIDNGETIANLIKNDDGTWSYQSDFSEGSDTFRTREIAMKRAEADTTGTFSDRETKFLQYTLPGGKNYKEILIRAPKKIDVPLPSYAKAVKDKSGKWYIEVDVIGKASGLYSSEKEAILDYNKQTLSDDASFKSPHWDEPNVLSHLRLNERDYKNKDVTFVEEIQSDWASEGREKGFIKSDQVEFDEYSESLKKKYNTTNPTLNATPAEIQKWNNLLIGETGVPSNILLKNWQELTIKRALQEAVKNKSAYLAWITGEQTSARYNLATHLDKVNWGSIPTKVNGEKQITLHPKSAKNITLNIDKSGVIDYTTNGEWEGKKLNEVIGKGLADKIMASEKGDLSGEGLKFGGEWAVNLYDKQFKNIVEDLTGAKVEVLDMGLPVEGKDIRWTTGKDYKKYVDTGDSKYLGNAKTTDLKVEGEIVKAKEGTEDVYIITDVLKDGKFKAVSKSEITKQYEVLLTPDNVDGSYGKYMVREKGKTGRIGTFHNTKAEAERHIKEFYEEYTKETFDISIKKSAGQQAIKLTPEIVAKIKGEAPKIKAPSGVSPIVKVAKITKEVKPPSAKKVLGIKPSTFVVTKKRETTLLTERIKDIQKQAKAENWGKVKLAQEIEKARIRQEKAVREEQLKTIKAGITERFKGIERGIREGKIITKQEIKTTQTELLDILDKSNLELSDKAKFRRAIKNIQTQKQLVKVLPEFQERIATLETKATRKQLISTIKKELKKFRIKKRGKIGKTSVQYEMLRNAMNKKYFDKSKLRSQAQNKELLTNLQANIETYDITNPIHHEDFVLYALLSENTKGLNEMSNIELEETSARILQTRELARDSFLLKQLIRAGEIRENIEGSVENMQGKGVIDQTSDNKRTIAEKLKQFVATADIYDRGFLQIVNLLDSIRGGKFYKKVIYQPISEANKDYFVKNDNYLEADKKMLKTVFNKTGTLLDRQIKGLNKQIYIGEITDAQNKKFNLWFTNLEMIDIYLSSKTKETLNAMQEQGIYVGGKDIGTRVFYMTDDVLAKIENSMSPEAKAIAKYISDSIANKDFIKSMTDAYVAKYNKPFPFVKDGYWTMRRRYMGGRQIGEDVFNPAYSQQTVLSPSSFHKRVKNDNPLSISDGWAKYIKHRTDILKFVSYDGALMNAKSVIMSQDFKSEFIEVYGNKSYSHLLNSFNVTANGMKHYGDIMASGANYIRQVLSVSFIGGKLRNILSQGTSFVAAISDIPIRDFNKSLGEFIANPKKGYNKMMSSPLIRLRHKRADFTRGLFEEEVKQFKQHGFSATKTSMFFTKVGDMMGVIGAGYAVYNYNYNKYIADKMDPVSADKSALQDAENFVISTQQSALTELKNAIMQAHPLVRTTGAFQQAQSMYRAKGFEAINTWLNSENRWDKATFRKMAKGVFTYHFTLPALYELSRGNINPLSVAAKTIFSPISGFMGYGKVVEYAVMYAIVKILIPLMGGDDDDWKDILPFDPNTLIGESLKIFQKTVNSVNDWIEGDADEKDITNLLDGSLMLLRVPSKNIREEYLKFEDLFSGTDTSFLRLLQTKWQSEQRLKKEEPKEKKSTKKVSPFDKDKGAGSKKKSPFDK